MVASNKTRVVLSIDKKIWYDLKENLKSEGFPQGTASWIVQQQFEQLNLEFEAVSRGAC